MKPEAAPALKIVNRAQPFKQVRLLSHQAISLRISTNDFSTAIIKKEAEIRLSSSITICGIPELYPFRRPPSAINILSEKPRRVNSGGTNLRLVIRHSPAPFTEPRRSIRCRASALLRNHAIAQERATPRSKWVRANPWCDMFGSTGRISPIFRLMGQTVRACPHPIVPSPFSWGNALTNRAKVYGIQRLVIKLCSHILKNYPSRLGHQTMERS